MISTEPRETLFRLSKITLPHRGFINKSFNIYPTLLLSPSVFKVTDSILGLQISLAKMCFNKLATHASSSGDER